MVRRAFSGVLVGECVAVCPHCRAGPSRAGRPEELASVPSASPATRAVVTGAEGARVGGGAAAPLVRGSDSGRAAGVVLSRTTGQASHLGNRPGRVQGVGAGVAGSGEITAQSKYCVVGAPGVYAGGWRSWARQL